MTTLLLINDPYKNHGRCSRVDRTDMFVVPADDVWNLMEVPRLSAKDTATGIVLPPPPSHVPFGFPRPNYNKGVSGPRPIRVVPKPPRTSLKKKKNIWWWSCKGSYPAII
jgi:hypothetical protein